MLIKYNNSDNFKFDNTESFVESCWWNIYDEGDYFDLHHHIGPPQILNNKVFYPSFSMIYILHDENEKSSIVFKKYGPLPLMKPHQDCVFNTSHVETIGEGSIIIFPYNLLHLVLPSIKSGRVTIAYNIYSAWDEITQYN